MKEKKIPMELMDFLKNPYSQSLVVKGEIGTGKTTLALELLDNILSNGVYITTRVNVDKVLKQFSWINSSLPSNKILDLSKKNNGIDFKIGTTDLISPKIINKIFKQLSLNKLDTVVIDSWDALCDLVLLNDSVSNSQEHELIRNQFELNFLEQIRNNDLNVIVTTENFEKKNVEYISDGVIKLQKESYPWGELRIAYFEKLRGIPIKQPEYIFSLNGGRFNCLQPLELNQPKRYKNPKPLKDPNQKTISTGSFDIDQILHGGYNQGKFYLYIISSGADNACNLIQSLTIINYLNQQKGVCCTPFEGFNENTINKYIRPYVKNDAISQYLGVMKYQLLQSSSLKEPYTVEVVGEAFEEDFEQEQKTQNDLKKKTKGQSIISIVGFDTLEHIYGQQNLKKLMGQYIASKVSDNDVLIGIIKDEQNSAKILSHMADKQIYLKNIKGTIILHGLSPNFGLFGLNVNTDKGYPKIDLMQMM